MPDRIQYDLFRIIGPMCAVILSFLLIAGIIPSRWKRAEVRMWAIFTIAAIGFLATNSLEILSTNRAASLMWSRCIYLFICFLPLFWLEFCLRFTRNGRGMNKALMAVLAVLSAATIFVVFSDSLMHLMWPSITWLEQPPWVISVRSHGIWFAVYAASTYSLYTAGAFILLRAFILYRNHYRKQAFFVLLAVAVPFFLNIVYLFQLIPGQAKDCSALGYAVTAVLLYVGLFRAKMFSFSPVARDFIIERMHDGILVLDRQNRLIDANPAAFEILGLGELDLGMTFSFPMDLVRDKNGIAAAGKQTSSCPDQPDPLNMIIEALESHSPREFSIIRSGKKSWYHIETFDLGNSHSGRLVTIRDQTETKTLLLRIEEMASTDELTKIPNRRCFMRESNRQLALSSRHGLKLAVAMFDLDHFKAVNDTFGHQGGDLALQTFSSILVEEIRGEDLAGRIGGEEFAMCFMVSTDNGAAQVLDRIRAHIESREIIDQKGRIIRLTVSIGYALNDEGCPEMNTLIARADQALYEAKSLGRNRIEQWTKKDDDVLNKSHCSGNMLR